VCVDVEREQAWIPVFHHAQERVAGAFERRDDDRGDRQPSEHPRAPRRHGGGP
jgi:hypothetical protein